MARSRRSPRFHGGRMAPAGPVLDHATEERHLRTFRHWTWAFELVDHEAAPTVAAVLGLGTVVLAGMGTAQGGVSRPDGEGLTLVAMMAVLCLGAALLSTAAEVTAWAMARPVGRAAARAATALETAHGMIHRLQAAPPPEDAELLPVARRIDQAITHLAHRLRDADGTLLTMATLPDAETRASRLELLRDEARRITAAADALDGTAHLLRWIEACPWSPTRPDALGRLRTDLDAVERLISAPADRA